MNHRCLEVLQKSGKREEAYAAQVTQLLRMRYSLDEELALLRQRDSKPDEFAAYNTYAEACKAQAHTKIFGEGEEA